MIIQELLQRIQSLYSKGVQSDDSRLKSRHIYNKLLTVRNLLVNQKANKKQKLSHWNYQMLPGVELILAQKHEIPCAPPSGCKILRSKYKLPRLVNSINGYIIGSVSSINGEVLYNEISWEAYKHKKGSKYTSNKPDFYLRDGYLYITHKSGPQIISIEGVFEDPVEAMEFPNVCNKEDSCIDIYSMEFPIEGTLIEPLIEMSVEELVTAFNRSVEDNNNDGNDVRINE